MFKVSCINTYMWNPEKRDWGDFQGRKRGIRRWGQRGGGEGGTDGESSTGMHTLPCVK